MTHPENTIKQVVPRFDSGANTGGTGTNPPNPNIGPTQPPQQPPTPAIQATQQREWQLTRTGDDLSMQTPNSTDSITTPDEDRMNQAIQDFLEGQGTRFRATRRLLPRLQRQRPFIVGPPQPPPPAALQPTPTTPNTTVIVDEHRTRNRLIYAGVVVGALAFGFAAGYWTRDNNIFAGSGTPFSTQTLAVGQCVNAPPGSIAVGKASINGIRLYSNDPNVEMLVRLNQGAQVCATDSEPVTMQYLGGNSQLMDIVEQNNINLLQANGCGGRRCNDVTVITYPYGS